MNASLRKTSASAPLSAPFAVWSAFVVAIAFVTGCSKPAVPSEAASTIAPPGGGQLDEAPDAHGPKRNWFATALQGLTAQSPAARPNAGADEALRVAHLRLVIDGDGAPTAAGQRLRAHCEATDATGAALQVASRLQGEVVPSRQPPQSSIAALPPDGRRPAEGLRVVAGGLLAEAAGNYQVWCEADGSPRASAIPTDATQIQVEAAPAIEWRVLLHQQGRCFDSGRRLPVSWRAWDRFGNTVRDVQADLQTQPPAAFHRDAAGGFVFDEEGQFDITLTARGPGAERLPPYTTHLVVDSTPPKIELISPARASHVTNDHDAVLLRGRIVDNRHSIIGFSVEGVPQPIFSEAQAQDDDGPFSLDFEVPYRSRWGLNVVHMRAEDACGNTALLVQSFLQSGEFSPLWLSQNDDGEAVARDRLDGAVRASLSESLWDGQQADNTHDLRHLIEVALAGGGINDHFPQHLASWPESHSPPAWGRRDHEGPSGDTDVTGIDVWRDGEMTMSAPRVDWLRIEPQGFRVHLTFIDLNQPVLLDGWWGRRWWSLLANVSASELTIETEARVSMGSHGPIVEICDTCVTAQFSDDGPRVTLRHDDPRTPMWQRASRWSINWAMSLATKRVRASLADRVRSDMTREMGVILRGLKLEHALDLPALLRDRLEMQSGLDDIALRRPNNGPASCELSLYSDAHVRLNLARPRGMQGGDEPINGGPIRGPRQDAVPLLGSENSSSFAIAVSDDLLNQMFWSMWASGTFNSSALGAGQGSMPGTEAEAPPAKKGRPNLLDAAKLKVYFLAPPVVMPSSKPDEVRIGVGDVLAEVNVDTPALFGSQAAKPSERLSARFYFSLAMRARLGVDVERHSLKIASLEASHAQVQVTEISSPQMLLAVTYWLEKMIRLSMPQHLERAMVSVPLPNLHIGRLPGVPDEAVWALKDVSLSRLPSAQETILRGRFDAP